MADGAGQVKIMKIKINMVMMIMIMLKKYVIVTFKDPHTGTKQMSPRGVVLLGTVQFHSVQYRAV